MVSVLDHIIGPRVGQRDLAKHGMKYGAPGFILLIARVLLLISLFVPFWHMELVAPQYPENLHLTAYVNHLAGDVAEINSLNHYIGMRPLEEAASVERTIGVYIMILFVIMLELASFIHSRWAVLLVLPVLTFPLVFLADLYFWMSHFGMNLDPDAPLSNSIEPFTPPILGSGFIGQFETIATAGPGLILASIASVLMIVALFFHRRAYKPLVMASKAAAKKAAAKKAAD
jgi:copper chaperone NosL